MRLSQLRYWMCAGWSRPYFTFSASRTSGAMSGVAMVSMTSKGAIWISPKQMMLMTSKSGMACRMRLTM